MVVEEEVEEDRKQNDQKQHSGIESKMIKNSTVGSIVSRTEGGEEIEQASCNPNEIVGHLRCGGGRDGGCCRRGQRKEGTHRQVSATSRSIDWKSDVKRFTILPTGLRNGVMMHDVVMIATKDACEWATRTSGRRTTPGS